MTLYPNGLGMTGDPLVTNRPLYLKPGAPGGQVWYVNSATGSDAASPQGLSPEYPLATLGQAITNSGSNDVIVLMSGHTETLAGVTFGASRRTTIVGEGTAAGKPTVKLTCTAGSTLLTTSATTLNCVTLKNVWFTQPSAASTAPILSLSSGRDVIDGCYFECGPNNGSGAYAISLGAAARITNCTFVSTATAVASRPDMAVFSSAVLTGVRMDGIVFDGGAKGFSTYAFQETGAWTDFTCENMSLLRGADVQLNTNTTGYVQVSSMSGGARLEWGTSAATYYPSGFGDTTGTTYTTGPNVWCTGQVWWVDSASGTDSTTDTHGKTPEWPLATLAYAWAQASTGDIIVLKATHAETFTASLSNIGKILTVVGMGRSGGFPSVKLTPSVATGLFGTAGAGVITHLRNLWFKESTVASSLAPVAYGNFIGPGSDAIIDSCYFECGALVASSNASALYVEGERLIVKNCTFKSVTTDKTVRPLAGVYHNGNAGGSGRDYFTISECTFDGGTYGWQDVAFRIAAQMLALRAQNIHQLNGADISFHANTAGYLVTGTSSANSRVVW